MNPTPPTQTDAERVYWKLGMDLRGFIKHLFLDFVIKCLTDVTPETIKVITLSQIKVHGF